MICRGCGFNSPKDARFCGMCGNSLGLQCPRCGQENPSGCKFCSYCGVSLGAGSPRAEGSAHVTNGHAADISDAGAERRQMTVMFCDLVGSTALAERLDPEELRDVIREYQANCDKIIAAHEDDALRAVRAGLQIVREMHSLSDRLESSRGFGLHIRIGIHTGLVVVGRRQAWPVA